MAFLKLPDLDTRSVLEVVEENYQNAALKAFAIRMIYIGEHTMSKNDIIKQFKKSVRDVNSGYTDVSATGLLLVYDSYFVHIIEGSEDTVHRQIRFLFQREIDWIAEMERLEEIAAAEAAAAAAEAEEPVAPQPVVEEEPQPKPERKMFRKLKLLITYHSISTLLFENWSAITARPPSLVGKLNQHGPLSEHIEQLTICLDKIKKLCNLAQTDEHLSFEGLSAADPKMEALPEVALLDFLLQSQHVLDMRQVSYLHRRVDDYIFYFERVWPLPTHFTPRFLYKLKIDDSFVPTLAVMPWEMKKEEEEEREEKQSVSSDSD